MARREKFTAEVTGAAPRVTFAWNSAIRATEEAMRELARLDGLVYNGGAPLLTRQGDTAVYTRTWTSITRTRTARVSGPAAHLHIAGLPPAPTEEES